MQRAVFSNVMLENIRDLYTQHETEWERNEDLKMIIRFLQNNFAYIAQVRGPTRQPHL